MKRPYLFTFIVLLLSTLFLPVLSVHKKDGPAGGTDSPPPMISGEWFKVLIKAENKVVQLKTEEYLWGVVAAEMLASSEEEALKAQTVAAYTFALRARNQNRVTLPPELQGADITDDPSRDQGYISKEAAKAKWGNE